VADKPLSGRRILAVEDDMLIRLTLEDMLAELGCEAVSTAGTIDQALDLIDVRVFDAATLDVNLGGVSSYAVADALAARGVPFAFVTGYGAKFLRDGYQERPILKKPFAFEDLSRALTNLIC
jgi:CheY-like chemotaxis protein